MLTDSDKMIPSPPPPFIPRYPPPPTSPNNPNPFRFNTFPVHADIDFATRSHSSSSWACSHTSPLSTSITKRSPFPKSAIGTAIPADVGRACSMSDRYRSTIPYALAGFTPNPNN